MKHPAGTLVVTGGSDDLIEIDGDIREEFNVHMEDDLRFVLGFSEGTLLEVEYDKDGLWRFRCLVSGAAEMSKKEGSPEADTFDVVTLKMPAETPIRWVMFGHHYVVRKERA